MNAHIEIENASVSYFLRKSSASEKAVERGKVGAAILARKRYLEITALRDISISLRSGMRVGLIGINGSGKSTLLKACAGALSAQSGKIEIQGRVSPQFALGSGLRPELSGRRNAELKCLYMGIPHRSIAARIEEVKELSGLGGYFELPVHSYSAGMRSRLIMSLMRLMKGDILVMDEWISAADASINKTVSRLQTDLIQSSSILVLASHTERILRDWTETLVWLEQGEIKAVGPVDDVYKEYTDWLKSRN